MKLMGLNELEASLSISLYARAVPARKVGLQRVIFKPVRGTRAARSAVWSCKIF